ncbi:MAG TPA: RodZ domain-containing protein [Nevskiaceae bacterium]
MSRDPSSEPSLEAPAPDSGDAPRASTGGPGDLIRRARERAQVSVEELAAQTKLARGTLEALEREDFEHLMEPVYVRGYYRKCAKILGIPDSEVMAAYDRVAPTAAEHAQVRLLLPAGPREFSPRRRRRHGGLWLAIVLVIIIIALLAWYAQRSRAPHEARVGAATPAVATAPAGHAAEGAAPGEAPTTGGVEPGSTPGAAGAETQAQGAGNGITTISPTTEAPGEAANTAAQPGNAAAGAVAEAAPHATPAAAATQLTLDFTGRSWVQVTDATGTRLLSGVFPKGQHQVLDGTPPYDVSLGDAHAVTVYYQDKRLSISSLIQSNSTARFRVPLSP